MIEKHKQLIKSIVDYPKKGIIFRDITPLLEDKNAFTACLSHLGELFSSIEFNKIACIEARGFLLGAALSQSLNKDLVLLRKAGKLPRETYSQDYDLEYGTATLEVHRDSLSKEDRVLIIDDLLATGGTIEAAMKLINMAGAKSVAAAVLINLPDLPGESLLERNGIPLFKLFEFKGH